MDTRRVQHFARKFQLCLAILCALYFLLIAATAFALNHTQALRLDHRYISRIWLAPAYASNAGYEVQLDVVLRDLNTALLFSNAGARVLDAFLLLWLSVAAVHIAAWAAKHRDTRKRLARRPPNATMRPPLSKAAPYGDTGRRSARGKVLQFRR